MAKIDFPKASSLSDINKIVSQYEETDGPLVAMNNDGANYTVLTFDATQDNPAVVAVVEPYTGTAPTGPTVVCTGKIFIAGALRDAAAIRK